MLNESELAELAGLRAVPESEAACWRAMRAARHSARQTIILTRGSEGALALAAAGCWRVPGLAVAVADTTGAGDCFVGAFAAARARGKDLPEALAFANAAAALSVTRPGASAAMPTRADLATVAMPVAQPLRA